MGQGTAVWHGTMLGRGGTLGTVGRDRGNTGKRGGAPGREDAVKWDDPPAVADRKLSRDETSVRGSALGVPSGGEKVGVWKGSTVELVGVG